MLKREQSGRRWTSPHQSLADAASTSLPKDHHETQYREKTPAKKTNRRKGYEKRRNIRRQFYDNLAYLYRKTIDHFFRELYEDLQQIPDLRQFPRYELYEVLLSALLVFLFKKGSRNALNAERENPRFVQELKKLLGFRLVHLDLADCILRKLDEAFLEKLNWKLIHILLEKKVIHSQRLLGKYFLLAVDGSQVFTVQEGHCSGCLSKTSKSGKNTYFHNVLEAKIVTANGFAISLASEWVHNEGKQEFEKQDCELKAFQRLAEKIQKEFPQVPFCLLADGLYPNSTVFEVCDPYQWQWILTLKAG